MKGVMRPCHRYFASSLWAGPVEACIQTALFFGIFKSKMAKHFLDSLFFTIKNQRTFAHWFCYWILLAADRHLLDVGIRAFHRLESQLHPVVEHLDVFEHLHQITRECD